MSKNITKFVLILAAFVLVAVTLVFLITRRSNVAYQYDQVMVGKVTETVNVNGNVKAAEGLDLSFQVPGKIAQKNVNVGDKVKAGQTLLSLDNADSAAQLAQAQAALDKQLAGNRPEYLAQLQAAVDQAQAGYNQVSVVAGNSVHTAQSVKETADNNLKMAQGGDDSRIVGDAYENAANFLPAVQNSISNAMTKADNILGLDNTFANDKFEKLLSAKDPSKLNLANNAYYTAKLKVQDFLLNSAISEPVNHAKVDVALVSADSALTATRDTLSAVSFVLDNTISGADLNSSELDAMKTTVTGVRTDIGAKISALTDQKHAIATAKDSYANYQVAADKAAQDLSDITKKTTADVAAAQAALDGAKAVLANAKNPPREVDLASYRAAVAGAAAVYNKTILTAPFDGTISRADAQVGLLTSAGVSPLSIISNSKYQIDAYVTENDLAKIKLGDNAVVTLDNLGAGVEFPAQLIKIDLAASPSTNGTTAYKISLQFNNDDDRLRVGLSANIKITSGEKDNALLLPSRDMVQKNGQYFVTTLKADQSLEQKQVEIGLRGDDGNWEIVSGLAEGDKIVSFSALK
ncbi:MAG: efflux RND transporter periplasmic adaptor subunit [Candidatus Falkowbacteria bacterium]